MKGETNKMCKCKINIDLDKNIIDFCKDNINDKVDVGDYIQNIVKNIASKEELYVDEISVSIASATKDEIKQINKKYREIDKVTDVLSFPIFTKEELKDIINKEDDKKIKSLELGDIIICLDIVKVQAVEYETGILRELLYMITHGMCHLVGYDHIENEEKKEMRKLEEEILRKLGVEK